jgi:DNA-binding PadR family transcriptional regulator
MRDYSCKSSRVSSIRLFILGSLAERGAMHGHAVRLLADEEHITLWTDFTVGAVYGAFKRLAAEGLIAEVRTERDGNFPERQVFQITDVGITALGSLRQQAMREIVMRPDPIDLALARLGRDDLDRLGDDVLARVERLREDAAASRRRAIHVDEWLTVLERIVIQHKIARLDAEIAWHEKLLASIPAIVADEKSRKDAR